MNAALSRAIETRRSIYAIGKRKVVDERTVRKIVEFATKQVPSAFNSQSARVVVLFGSESDRFWTLVHDALKKIVPPDAFPQTEAKLTSFAAGLGTILFFEEQKTVEDLQERFALYRDNFPVWSLQSNGMLEYAVWTLLAEAGLGASLQHYNPLIDDAVKKAWNLPASWKLLAEMPFGSVEAPAGDKEFLPIEERVKVFG